MYAKTNTGTPCEATRHIIIDPDKTYLDYIHTLFAFGYKNSGHPHEHIQFE